MRPHGAFFFRHMQNDSIAHGRLRSRSDTVRRTLLGWMATARNALLIGFDTGHLALSALHLAPELRITAIDAGKATEALKALENDVSEKDEGKDKDKGGAGNKDGK